MDHKTVYVNRDGNVAVMSTDRCKLYNPSTSTIEPHAESDNPAETALREDAETRDDFEETHDDTWEIVNNNDVFSECLVNILQSDDPRIIEKNFMEANKKKVDGLQSRGTWEKIHESELPQNENIVFCRYIHSLKNFLTLERMAMVRYVAQEFGDALKEMLAQDVNALRPASIPLILCITAVFSLSLFSHYVTQVLSTSETSA